MIEMVEVKRTKRDLLINDEVTVELLNIAGPGFVKCQARILKLIQGTFMVQLEGSNIPAWYEPGAQLPLPPDRIVDWE